MVEKMKGVISVTKDRIVKIESEELTWLEMTSLLICRLIHLSIFYPKIKLKKEGSK